MTELSFLDDLFLYSSSQGFTRFKTTTERCFGGEQVIRLMFPLWKKAEKKDTRSMEEEEKDGVSKEMLNRKTGDSDP